MKTKISIIAVVLIMATQALNAQWEVTGNIISGTDWFGAQPLSDIPVSFEHRADDPASRFEWHTHDGTNFADRMHLTRIGWLGLNIADPDMMFHVDDGGILSTGSTGTNPDLGAGTRLMWIPDQAAFRAGIVNGTQWDGGNVGDGSVAFGSNNLVSGDFSAAFADLNEITGARSFAFGSNNLITASRGVAVGLSNEVSGNGGVAFGVSNEITESFGMTFGQFLLSSAEQAMVFNPHQSHRSGTLMTY